MRRSYLAIIFVLSILLACSYRQSAKASSEGTMNATLTPYLFYYIVLSEKLSEGIFFTNSTGASLNIQYPILSGSSGNNAVWNSNQSGQTGYYVYINGNVGIDLCNGAVNHLCSTPGCSGTGNVLIDISNARWGSSLADDQSNPSSSGSTPFSIGYDNNNKIVRNVLNKNVYLRFWLSLPPNTPALNYNTTYQIKAVVNGDNCA